MRILIISENKTLASGLEQQLQIKNLETETVYSGEIGEEYAELGIYDLMILDARLSGKNAMEITWTLRQKHCLLPVILLAQANGLEDRIKALKCGVDYTLLMPYDNRELLASVDALLRKSTDQAEEPMYGNTRAGLKANPYG